MAAMSLRETLLANRQLKALALLAAFAIWLLATMEAQGEVNLPLQIRSADGTGQFGAVKVAGPRILLLRQKLVNAVTVIDPPGGQAGVAEIRDLANRVQVVPGVRLIAVSLAGKWVPLLPDTRTGRECL